MIARLVFSLCLLGAASALSAQSDLNLDLTPDEILTGEADATLQDLGARAAAEGATLVVTAPDYWHQLIGEQISAGAGDAGVAIEYKNTVIEAAWVRTREAQRAAAEAVAPAAPVEEEVAPSATLAAPPPEVEVAEPEIVATATPAPQAVQPQVDTSAVAEQARLDALDSLRESMRASSNGAGNGTEVENQAVADAPAEQAPAPAADNASQSIDDDPVTTPSAETQVASAAPVQSAPVEPVSATPDGVASGVDPAPAAEQEVASLSVEDYRADLQERVNFGRPIRRDIDVEEVRAGDELFTSGPVIAVVRRNKAGINSFWLNGTVDFNRSDISEIQRGRYLVERDLREPEVEVAAVEPVEEISERDRMQQRYNRGRNIRDDLDASLLREDDVIYTSQNLAVVIRREQIRAKAYWLVGELDLSDDRIRKEGSNKYRVLLDF